MRSIAKKSVGYVQAICHLNRSSSVVLFNLFLGVISLSEYGLEPSLTILAIQTAADKFGLQ